MGEYCPQLHTQLFFVGLTTYLVFSIMQQVSVGYRGKQRYIGAFPAQDDAESAKKIAVEILTSSENKSECKISAGDIELYVKAAKEAAAEAVKKKNGVVVPAVTPEPAVKKMKPFPEQQASRPPIMRGRKGGKVWKKSSKTKSSIVGVYATSNGKWVSHSSFVLILSTFN